MFTNTYVFLWRENMPSYFSADVMCSEKWTVFPEKKVEENCKLRGIYRPVKTTAVIILLEFFKRAGRNFAKELGVKYIYCVEADLSDFSLMTL